MSINPDLMRPVIAVNRIRRMAAVRAAQGITVFTWESPVDVMEGDVIAGPIPDDVEESNLYNASAGTALDARIVASRCSDDGAVQLLFV